MQQPLSITSPPLTPWGHRRWKRLALFLLATVAVGCMLAFRWYRGGGKGLRGIHGQQHDLQGCHAPFNIDLWPHGQVPHTLPQYDKGGGGPFLTAYIPPGKPLSLPSASRNQLLQQMMLSPPIILFLFTSLRCPSILMLIFSSLHSLCVNWHVCRYCPWRVLLGCGNWTGGDSLRKMAVCPRRGLLRANISMCRHRVSQI
jgi:hypothetical protein